MTHSDDPLAEDPNASHSAFTKAVCLDLPYIVGSVWRHTEYDANRLFSYQIAQTADGRIGVSLAPRPYNRSPAFWFFLLTLAFAAYGPTFDAWCSIVGATGMRNTRASLGIVAMVGALIAWVRLCRYGRERAQKRFKKAKPPVLKAERWRRGFVHVAVQLVVLCPVAALGLFGWFLLNTPETEVCHAVPSPVPAQLQLLVLLAAGALAHYLGRRPMMSVCASSCTPRCSS
jgi:hypothetical protein